jgi:hypothetical protein
MTDGMVTDQMIDAALDAWWRNSQWRDVGGQFVDDARRDMRAALVAALVAMSRATQ